jgi:hypothetical protein
MNTMKFAAALVLLTSTTAAFADQRECDSTLKSILQLNKVSSLPPVSTVEDINETLKEIQEIQNQIQEKRRQLGPEPDDLLDGRASGPYRAALAPFFTRLNRATQSLESAEIMRLAPGRHQADVRDSFDHIENRGKPVTARIYLHENRIAGVQLVNDGHVRTYILKADCGVKEVTEGYDKGGGIGIQAEVHAQICSTVPQLKGTVAALPEKSRDYEDACLTVDGQIYLTQDGGRYCTCGEYSKDDVWGSKARPIPINPWAQNCGRKSVEDDVRELVEKNHGFVWSGLKPEVKKIIDLCQEHASILAPSAEAAPSTLPSGNAPAAR